MCTARAGVEPVKNPVAEAEARKSKKERAQAAGQDDGFSAPTTLITHVL